MPRRLQSLNPTINLSTITDGRGGIFTWVPEDPIVEFNLIELRAGKVRGMHYHPHFTEYLLFVSGSGVMLWRDIDTGPVEKLMVAKGTVTRAVPGVAHAIYASEDMVFIAMLTREWDRSDPPVMPFDLW